MDSGANKNVDISVALEKLGRGSKLVWTVFFFTVLSTFFSALHTVSYIFTAEVTSLIFVIIINDFEIKRYLIIFLTYKLQQ